MTENKRAKYKVRGSKGTENACVKHKAQGSEVTENVSAQREACWSEATELPRRASLKRSEGSCTASTVKWHELNLIICRLAFFLRTSLSSQNDLDL